jgi:hypothetical protein
LAPLSIITRTGMPACHRLMSSVEYRESSEPERHVDLHPFVPDEIDQLGATVLRGGVAEVLSRLCVWRGGQCACDENHAAAQAPKPMDAHAHRKSRLDINRDSLPLSTNVGCPQHTAAAR